MQLTTNQTIGFLRTQKDFFKREFRVKKIGVFGSYARGNITDERDIDIVVELERPDMFYMIGIKQVIEESVGVKVDIVRLREKMNKALKQRIEKDVIYV
ncbi:MAG: nucleotidyltransferase domain-containing protein [Candidatus Scalindua sp.]|nr:nucleotidyltransferase domain-containing protein [Candidatus Scalindua sp.]